jgi:hypothetical protein
MNCGAGPQGAQWCKLPRHSLSEELSMSKGMERKKEQKKKPAKTLEEKRAAKKEKQDKRK